MKRAVLFVAIGILLNGCAHATPLTNADSNTDADRHLASTQPIQGILLCGFPAYPDPNVNGEYRRSSTRYEVDFNKDGNVYLISWDSGKEPPVVSTMYKVNEVVDGIAVYFTKTNPLAVEILMNPSGVHLSVPDGDQVDRSYIAECK